MFIWIVIIGLGLWLVWRMTHRPAPPPPEFEVAEYGVPHGKFQKTGDGFTFSFRLPSHFWRQTKVEVTKDAVIIDKKKLARADLVGFSVDHKVTPKDVGRTFAVLGYTYGRRSYPFGGLWLEGQASEVASALNVHLRAVPTVEGETQVTAAQLRDTRSTEF